MSVNFENHEVDQYAAFLRDVEERIAPAARDIVRKTAFDIQHDAMIFVPVLTGFLRSSITVTFAGTTRNFFQAVVGPTAHYGLWVEIGTTRMEGRWYMKRATDRHEPLFIEAAAQLGLEVVS